MHPRQWEGLILPRSQHCLETVARYRLRSISWSVPHERDQPRYRRSYRRYRHRDYISPAAFATLSDVVREKVPDCDTTSCDREIALWSAFYLTVLSKSLSYPVSALFLPLMSFLSERCALCCVKTTYINRGKEYSLLPWELKLDPLSMRDRFSSLLDSSI